MTYFLNLLRQSAARVGPVQKEAIHAAAGLEVDDLRGVHPRSAPVTRASPFGERPADQPEREAAETPPQRVVPAVAPVARVDAAQLLGDAAPINAAPSATVEHRPPVVPSATPPAQMRHAASGIESRKGTPADVPPEVRALRSVAEVVTWIAAAAEAENPRPGVETVHALDISEQADDPLQTASAPMPVDAPPADRDASLRDPANVTVSVGTIELTVDDPAGTVAPPQPTPPPVAPPDLSGVSASRLSRYYLRP
jgi:hypothetical protein